MAYMMKRHEISGRANQTTRAKMRGYIFIIAITKKGIRSNFFSPTRGGSDARNEALPPTASREKKDFSLVHAETD